MAWALGDEDRPRSGPATSSEDSSGQDLSRSKERRW
jgi:hypothetical protein